VEIPVRPKATGMNLTPLIDIVFLLLVFFLLTTRFVEEDGIGVKLPRAASRAEAPKEAVSVAVTRTGEVFFRGRPVPLGELEDRLRKHLGQGGTVVIRGDRDSVLQTVVSVMEAAKHAGAGRIVVATLREGEGG